MAKCTKVSHALHVVRLPTPTLNASTLVLTLVITCQYASLARGLLLCLEYKMFPQGHMFELLVLRRWRCFRRSQNL